MDTLCFLWCVFDLSSLVPTGSEFGLLVLPFLVPICIEFGALALSVVVLAFVMVGSICWLVPLVSKSVLLQQSSLELREPSLESISLSWLLWDILLFCICDYYLWVAFSESPWVVDLF